MAKVLWTQKQDIGPLPRAGHAMTFDTARRRVVLFGGDSLAGTFFGDTWGWDGDSWTQMQDIGPSPRGYHAITFDSARSRAVLFGGRSAAGRLGDTWEWDGESWTQVADSGPAVRLGHAMAFDSHRQRVVLFGGESDDNAVHFNDTWEWDGNEWVQQADSGPSPRMSTAMAFDSTRNRLVLFGGIAQNATPLGDTWEWDGSAWTEEADFGPDPCGGAAAAFKGTRVALFGGITSILAPPPTPTLFNRSWEWNGSHWTARQDMGPSPRAFHAMAFDSARSRVVLFGGSRVSTIGAAATDARGDTWEQFDSEPVSAPPPASTPPPTTTGLFANLVADPNPASPAQLVTFTATIAPRPVTTIIDVLLDGQPVGTMQIPAQMTQGTLQFRVPPGQPAGVMTLAARSNDSETAIALVILASVPVAIGSLTAMPQTVSAGQAVTFSVTIADPAPQATAVALSVRLPPSPTNIPIGSIPIAAGAVSGQTQFEVPGQPGVPNFDAVFRVESAGSQAETTVHVSS